MSDTDNKTLSDARETQVVLGDIESNLPKDLTAENLGKLIAKGDGEVAKLKQLEADIAATMEAKRQTMKELNDFMKRVRAGAKSAYGDDSLEYERVGGKRRSEIKRSRSKTTTAA